MKSKEDKHVIEIVKAFKKLTNAKVLQVDVDECGVVIYYKQREGLFKGWRYGQIEFVRYDRDERKCR